MLLDINGWEFIFIVVLALVLIGPERLPEYASRLRDFVQGMKKTAEGAKQQLREQVGPEFDAVDWKAYDPRQYDPRKIVREALLEEPGRTPTVAAETVTAPVAAAMAYPSVVYDPTSPTPYDDEAT
ncbi:sec-independent protein translocase protein TatB [Austwickia chelonae]|uniref:Sec-independent protein translocase protein TatB n=1 Tax=Austwickia chelonae NBRC 105200 TaxID=1184607 RepID=K6W8U4_9MICO|nr:twin-arginine translocase TatA/TatE family subunit [Austwickia chelonae]GAB78247.1 Sec-independent protein translocase protein TatB [Austwickia chelonae NBRC 105200]SEV99570.1 sec-independent protein translocase protein TatB [Austwickia chelonae]